MKTNSDQPSSKRRKIVTGSLAAPVVLTVSSPAAATMTTFGKCLANQATTEPNAQFFSVSPDSWLRADVPVVKLRHGNDAFWFFKDTSLGDYIRVDTREAMGWGATIPNQWNLEAESTRRALVWVEAKTGSPLGVVQLERPSGYTATTMSCYTSIRPTKG